MSAAFAIANKYNNNKQNLPCGFILHSLYPLSQHIPIIPIIQCFSTRGNVVLEDKKTFPAFVGFCDTFSDLPWFCFSQGKDAPVKTLFWCITVSGGAQQTAFGEGGKKKTSKKEKERE